MTGIRDIVILTGAGVSAESGVPTFRTRGGSTWWEVTGDDGTPAFHRIEDICTPQALARDEPLVQRFYDDRRAALATVAPNPAHVALARLDAEWAGDLLLVTQNVDDLHERAGSRRLLHMHGALLSALCRACGARTPNAGPLADGPSCPACGRPRMLRPDIVFFGEMPHGMARIEAALADADLFVAIGTSGVVYPAAGFVEMAAALGVATLEINLAPSATGDLFDMARIGPAGATVPAWVDEMLAGQVAAAAEAGKGTKPMA